MLAKLSHKEKRRGLYSANVNYTDRATADGRRILVPTFADQA
jgi:hypothetical protein